MSNLPVIGDPPTLEGLRGNYALYEALKYIMQALRDIVKYIKENTTTQIVP